MATAPPLVRKYEEARLLMAVFGLSRLSPALYFRDQREFEYRSQWASYLLGIFGPTDTSDLRS
jgi:hypothetical protein